MPTTIPEPPQKTEEKNEVSEKRKFVDKYISYLSAQGFKPEIDKDGDITFKNEGLQFYILIDAADETYFRVALPSIWTFESEEQRKSLYPLMLEISRGVKGIKLVPGNTSVWGYCEMFLARPDDYQAIFQRVIGSLQYAAGKFTDKVKVAPKKAEPS